MTSEYSQYLRQKLSQGHRVAECHRCWTHEDHGMVSERQGHNTTMGRRNTLDVSRTWIPLFLKNASEQDYNIIQADVKMSNVCNYSCAMCNPHDSSKIFDRWVREKNYAPIVEKKVKDPFYLTNITETYQDKRDYSHLRDILQQPLRRLKLLGGEPLLDKKMLDVLAEQNGAKKSMIDLHFITNGSQDLISAVEKLAGYNSVNFTVSIEAIGAVGEFMRPGSDWNYINNNISKARKQGINVSIHCVMQALNSLCLGAFLNWICENDLTLTLDVLRFPDFLALDILPDTLRDKAIANLEPHRHLKIRPPYGPVIAVETIQQIIAENKGQTDFYPQFLDFIEWHQQPLTTDLKSLQPEFYTYLPK